MSVTTVKIAKLPLKLGSLQFGHLGLAEEAARLEQRDTTSFKKDNDNPKTPDDKNAQPDHDPHQIEQKKPQALVCAHCRNPITHSRECYSVQGDSEHQCLNPAGVLFHIQCFRTAPGCSVIGPATHEDSWFIGYSWQMAYCNRCQTHLGWHYQGLTPHFFGLIKKRLISEAQDE